MRTAVCVDTLVGPLSLLWDDEAIGTDSSGRSVRGAVVRSAFVPLRRFAASGASTVSPDAVQGDLAHVIEAVRLWSAGRRLDALDAVPVLQVGSEFRQCCWQALRGVKAGDIVSYGELAALAGNAAAGRAVGSAMSHNAVAPFVPCHRVIRADGVIGNYSAAGGADTKARLLAHEGISIT